MRDYWAVLSGCPLSPSALMRRVKDRFCELPPESLVLFAAPQGVSPGSELVIEIIPGQHCGVRVIHQDAQSLTLATLPGHPEAGRITFGSYRNSGGEVIFHIRSRARSSSAVNLVGFMAIGEAMQTNTWTDFISRTASLAEAQIRDAIQTETNEVEDTPADGHPLDSPTFVASGD